MILENYHKHKSLNLQQNPNCLPVLFSVFIHQSDKAISLKQSGFALADPLYLPELGKAGKSSLFQA